jgi:hypothetical protein
MFNNRQYQGVIARAGRGRHTRACRRILEFNLLIIGTLIFVGIGIASLHTGADHTATLKAPKPKNVQSHNDTAGAAHIVTATLLRGDGVLVRTAVMEVALPNQILTRGTTLAARRRMFETAARQSHDPGAPPMIRTAGWILAPHPLAVPLPVAIGHPTHRIVRTSHEPTATSASFTEDPPAPLVRLDTTTRTSPFWYVAAGLSLAAFACGFWNSHKPRKTN